jgi:hypothetical protein
VGTARRLAGIVLVDARGADNGEPPQHVARGGAERDHRQAAHDAGLRARAPCGLTLEAEAEHHAVVLATFTLLRCELRGRKRKGERQKDLFSLFSLCFTNRRPGRRTLPACP